jgi:hypothetical protein
LYDLFYQQMKKDPFNFEVFKFCQDNNLSKQIYQASYSKAVHLIGKIQEAYCNKLLFKMPGFKFISRPHIQSISLTFRTHYLRFMDWLSNHNRSP